MGLLRSQTGRQLLAMLLCLAMGGHWWVLQSVAWTGMLISYSRESGVAKAVAMTFDGKHPCTLCARIQEGQQKERQRQPALTRIVPDGKFLAPPSARLPEPLFRYADWPELLPTRPPNWSVPPAVPPPRPVIA